MFDIVYKDAEKEICENSPHRKYVQISANGPDNTEERVEKICFWLTAYNTNIKHLYICANHLHGIPRILDMFAHHVSITWLKLFRPEINPDSIDSFARIASNNTSGKRRILLLHPFIELETVEPLVNAFRASSVEFRIWTDFIGKYNDNNPNGLCVVGIPTSIWMIRGKTWGVLKNYRELNRPAQQALSEEEADRNASANLRLNCGC